MAVYVQMHVVRGSELECGMRARKLGRMPQSKFLTVTAVRSMCEIVALAEVKLARFGHLNGNIAYFILSKNHTAIPVDIN